MKTKIPEIAIANNILSDLKAIGLENDDKRQEAIVILAAACDIVIQCIEKDLTAYGNKKPVKRVSL